MQAEGPTQPPLALAAPVLTVDEDAVAGSKYKGTCFIQSSGKWKAQITINGKVTYLGLFDNAKEAARKYDEAAAPRGRPVNFPTEGQVSSYTKLKSAAQDPSSNFKGVVYQPHTGKWKAELTAGGRVTYLGLFDDEATAAENYEEAVANQASVLARQPKEVGKKSSASKYKGVSFHAQTQKWKAQITDRGKVRYLGCFNDELEAAKKYDEAAALLQRPVNFPANDSGQGIAVKGGKGGTSKYKGVSWKKNDKKWQAQIMIDGKRVHLGCFDSEEEAAAKYDEAAFPLRRPLNTPTHHDDDANAHVAATPTVHAPIAAPAAPQSSSTSHENANACVALIAAPTLEATLPQPPQMVEVNAAAASGIAAELVAVVTTDDEHSGNKRALDEGAIEDHRGVENLEVPFEPPVPGDASIHPGLRAKIQRKGEELISEVASI